MYIVLGILGYIVGMIVTACFARWVDQDGPYMSDAWYGFTASLWPVFLAVYVGIFVVTRVSLSPSTVERVDHLMSVIASVPAWFGRVTGAVCPYYEER